MGNDSSASCVGGESLRPSARCVMCFRCVHTCGARSAKCIPQRLRAKAYSGRTSSNMWDCCLRRARVVSGSYVSPYSCPGMDRGFHHSAHGNGDEVKTYRVACAPLKLAGSLHHGLLAHVDVQVDVDVVYYGCDSEHTRPRADRAVRADPLPSQASHTRSTCNTNTFSMFASVFKLPRDTPVRGRAQT